MFAYLVNLFRGSVDSFERRADLHTGRTPPPVGVCDCHACEGKGILANSGDVCPACAGSGRVENDD